MKTNWSWGLLWGAVAFAIFSGASALADEAENIDEATIAVAASVDAPLAHPGGPWGPGSGRPGWGPHRPPHGPGWGPHHPGGPGWPHHPGGPGPGWGGPQRMEIDCSSQRYAYAECRVPGYIVDARLLVQYSYGRGQCIPGNTFGYYRDTLWVNEGCRGKFEVFMR